MISALGAPSSAVVMVSVAFRPSRYVEHCVSSVSVQGRYRQWTGCGVDGRPPVCTVRSASQAPPPPWSHSGRGVSSARLRIPAASAMIQMTRRSSAPGAACIGQNAMPAPGPRALEATSRIFARQSSGKNIFSKS